MGTRKLRFPRAFGAGSDTHFSHSAYIHHHWRHTMTGAIRQRTVEINAQIIEDIYENGLSMSSIMQKYGKSESTVHKLKKEHDRLYLASHGVPRERKKQPPDPRKQINAKGLSNFHLMVGMAIARYRAEKGLGPTEFGMLISRTGPKVTNMERGIYDFSLLELQSIASVLGTTVLGLLREKPKTHVHS